MSSKRFNPNKVIFHCSDTPDFDEDDKYFDLFGVEDIREWHKERGFSDVGYHYVIRRTGKIEFGRPTTGRVHTVTVRILTASEFVILEGVIRAYFR